ncbi:PKD domain-containing protein [candidate division KSB1 bacterium]|nr:PKD domain-containing protein [candidate division KSB1 bacterium]
MNMLKSSMPVVFLFLISMIFVAAAQQIEQTTLPPQSELACTADFTADKTSICAGQKVTFTDNSQGAISYYFWIFENGTPSQVTGKGPHTVTYNTTGSHDVTLTINCREGDDSITKQNYITVNRCACVAGFWASDTFGCAPLSVTFTDNSQNASAWYWSFPGGSPSYASTKGPHTVTYSSAGSYDAQLVIQCVTGAVDTASQEIDVRDCDRCQADIQAEPDSGCAPLTVKFYDNSSSNAASWYWQFPGGNPASANTQGPHTVTYNSSGSYIAYLKITCQSGQVDSTTYYYVKAKDCDKNMDFGDAPDPTYPTLLENNGARHTIKDGYHLGSAIDAESNGNQSSAADGDDLDASDDEDGITFITPLVAGQPAMAKITASDSGWINAWIDFNDNGSWSDAGEYFNYLPISSMGMTWVFPVPAGAKIGDTFARFRFSSQRELGFKGKAPDGEVEDYPVNIQSLGIRPYIQPFEHRVCLAIELNIAGLGLVQTEVTGTLLEHVYFEGTSAGLAQDDDSNGLDEVIAQLIVLDLTGFDPIVGQVKVKLHPTIPSYGLMEEQSNMTPGTLDVKPYSASGLVDSFFDVYFEISFPDIGMTLYTNSPKRLNGVLDQLPPVTDNVYTEATPITVPLYSPTHGDPVGKFGPINPCGSTIPFDYGDAPSSYDPTPPHTYRIVGSTTYFGFLVDSETSYQADANAMYDDLVNVDDEDGIFFTSLLIPGQNATVDVDLLQVTSTNFVIDAWIDFDRDGTWSNAERILAGETWAGGVFYTKSFAVPPTAVPGVTFARFIITDKSDPTHGYLYGEVEDHEIWIASRDEGYDWGDAPDPTYPTKLASNGAVHVIKKGMFLGAAIDDEPNGQPKPDADGDDLTGIDDEDGVTFSTMTPGNSATVQIVASMSASVNAWIDFDGDGFWTGSDEHIVIAQPVSAGPNSFTFTVPAGANQGLTYARIRYSSQRQLTYMGWAPDGEVEDYVVKIGEGEFEYDWGDLPAPYHTLRVDNGPYHIVDGTTKIGATVDTEQDGMPDPNALGDDNNGSDDEEGVQITTISNTNFVIHVPSYSGQQLALWVDLDRDGHWTDPYPGSMSAIFTGFGLGSASLSHYIPTGFPPGEYFTRVRVSQTKHVNPSPDGFGGIGEVEDHAFEFREEKVEFDYGDAPPPFPTKLSATSDGWRHPIKVGVHLGNGVDSEPDGIPDPNAEGDDNAGTDDEDGVISASPLIPGATTLIHISASTKGYLNGWIDFNQNSDWSDAGEQIFKEVALNAGINPLTFTVPGTALPGKAFARLRFSTQKLAYDPVHNLYIAMDGEVEDYYPDIQEPKAAAIGDWVWYDNNHNGLQEPGEPGIGGVTVELYDSAGNLKATTATAATGYYYFTGVKSGDYFVKFILPPGYSFSPNDQGTDDTIDSDPDPTTGSTVVFTVAAGQVDLTRDAGMYRTIQEGEFDFGDVPDPSFPTLLGSNGARHKIIQGMCLGSQIDPELDGQPMINAVGDDNDGMNDDDGVTFPPVWTPGSNVIIHVTAAGVPAGAAAFLNAWVDFDGNGHWTGPNEHIIIGHPLSNGVNIISTVTVPVTVTPGVTYARFRYSTVKNLGFDDAAPDGEVEDYRIYLGEKFKNLVGDLVWYDVNKNGIQDVGESGLAGVNVHLFDANNIHVGSTVTNLFGFYGFLNYPVNDYFLRFELPPHYSFSPQDQGMNDQLDSDADPVTGKTTVFHVSSTVIDESRDAGMFRTDQQNQYDFGDAPDPSYPTLHASGGAYHIIVPDFYLGAGIDDDINGQPDPNAAGDDNDGTDDEDGVLFTSALVPGNVATLEVTASQAGVLNAWIDFNINGDWADSDDRIYCDMAIGAGVNALSFMVPPAAVQGATFARFRLTKQQGLSYTGMAHDGEVEDYQVVIGEGGESYFKWHQWPLKWNLPDMPDCFNGWDELSVYSEKIVADDWYCYDERPVTDIHWWGSYLDWKEEGPPEHVPAAFHIGIWTDVPAGMDKPFSHPGKLIWEMIVDRKDVNEHPVGCDFVPDRMQEPETCYRYDLGLPQDQWFHQAGDSAIYWLSIAALYDIIPEKHIWGWKTRRHYFNDDAVSIMVPHKPIIGAIFEVGEPLPELWDMAFLLTTNTRNTLFDFGDTPDPIYPTLLLSNGAHHIYDPAVYLGNKIDTEPDAIPNPSAQGDDASAMDDEDGVFFLTPLSPGSPAKVEVFPSLKGYLNAWIDFNGNGVFFDSGERILVDELIGPGSTILEFHVPADASATRTFARFRFSTVKGLLPIGCAIDGEVEDYPVKLALTGVENESEEIPQEYDLMQNYPNPFNPNTDIVFKLPKTERVELIIYDLLGHKVRLLVDESRKAGTHRATWDARDDQGRTMPSGVYLYRITAGPFTQVRKMLLLK